MWMDNWMSVWKKGVNFYRIRKVFTWNKNRYGIDDVLAKFSVVGNWKALKDKKCTRRKREWTITTEWKKRRYYQNLV